MVKKFALSLCLLAAATGVATGNDSVVVFNEIMYHPDDGDGVEWIELHNQMAVDVDLSRWEITGADFLFPTNVIIGAGKYVVVASDPAALKARTGLSTNVFGPFTSGLSNGGERIRLRSHNDRIMDEVTYDDAFPWPLGPDGSGFTLAKGHPQDSGREPHQWQVSAQKGGTPGTANFNLMLAPSLRFSEISNPANGSFWIEIMNQSPVATSLAGTRIRSRGSVNASYTFPDTTPELAPGAFLVVDQTTLGFRPRRDDQLFLFGRDEASMHDAAIALEGTRARFAPHGDRWLVPDIATPGEPNAWTPPPVVINELMYHPRDLPPVPPVFTNVVVLSMTNTWDFYESAFSPSSSWRNEDFDSTSWDKGAALFYVETSDLPAAKNTPLNIGRIAYYFRTEFLLEGSLDEAELALEHIIDDGAVFYLNGREVHRFGMPLTGISHTTLANTAVDNAQRSAPIIIGREFFKEGRNVLAVQVHQNSTASDDIVFGCQLTLRRALIPGQDTRPNPNQWVEIHNPGASPVDLGGWSWTGSPNIVPAGTTIPPGGFLVFAAEPNLFRDGYPGVEVLPLGMTLSRRSELLELLDPRGNPVDQFRYYDNNPFPDTADGQGSSLELIDSRADNMRPEVWKPGADHSAWHEYSYSKIAQADSGPTRWNEFILGLLDSGEILLDDISVIEESETGSKEILRNGTFEDGLASWRFLGTHRQASVITDPDNPSNKVLHLLADGPTEHMHNHVETTLVGNAPIRNGRNYKVSFRAKWLSGNHRLNTRLYFARSARTIDLILPEYQGGTPGRANQNRVQNHGPTFSDFAHSPIVPRSSQSVNVSVTVVDPDNIQSCKLWYASGGTNWTSVNMLGFGSNFRGTIPARPNNTVVQFYLEAQDSQGAISFYPARGRDSRALYKVMDSPGLNTRRHNFRILMLPTEAAALHATTNVMSNGKSWGTFIYNDSKVFYDTSLHLQSSQRGRMSSERVGFTVAFPANNLFRGVHNSITFDRSGGWGGRGGRQDEIVMRHIMNQAGGLPDMYNDLVHIFAPLGSAVSPPNASSAMLLMAKYGEEFVEGSPHYDDDGLQFKLELIYYPTTSVGNDPQRPKIPQPDEVIPIDLSNRGDDPEAYRWFFLAENKQGDNDYRRLIEMSKAFSLSGPALYDRLNELIDFDQWIRVFAAKSLSGDADTYGFGYAHNHIFFLSNTEKAKTFPWDMDFVWTRGATESLTVGGRVGSVIHGYPANRRLFYGHINDIVNKSYNSAYISRWTTHYGSVAEQNYGGVLSYINQRATSAKAQLPSLAQFRITSNNGQSFQTNALSFSLRGSAPYTHKTLQFHGAELTAFRWLTDSTYEANLDLLPGFNLVQVVGHDFSGNAAATNSIAIFAGLDSDNDGLADEWETAHGLNPAVASADADLDGDGMTNLQEYLAGTKPNDPSEALRLQWSPAPGEQIAFQYQSKSGRGYILQTRNSLADTWTDFLIWPAQSGEKTIEQHISIEPGQPQRFYRLVLAP